MDAPEAMASGTKDLDHLLNDLRQAGQGPDRALLDRVKARGQDAVRPLIEMAIDEKLHEADHFKEVVRFELVGGWQASSQTRR